MVCALLPQLCSVRIGIRDAEQREYTDGEGKLEDEEPPDELRHPPVSAKELHRELAELLR